MPISATGIKPDIEGLLQHNLHQMSPVTDIIEGSY
jgi:hypothetical protein